jgi:hypothetical protein
MCRARIARWRMARIYKSGRCRRTFRVDSCLKSYQQVSCRDGTDTPKIGTENPMSVSPF